jgi:hypothetical protein
VRFLVGCKKLPDCLEAGLSRGGDDSDMRRHCS